MRRDGHLKPYEPQAFFEDGRTARPLVEGVVATDAPAADEVFDQGKQNGKPVDRVPFKITMETMRRGRERYNINCSMCHGEDGYGEGMVVQRGFPKPPSFHTDALRAAPDGHWFDVITNGFGRMQPLGFNVTPGDRWAIVAYVRALELSQDAPGDATPQAAGTAAISAAVVKP